MHQKGESYWRMDFFQSWAHGKSIYINIFFVQMWLISVQAPAFMYLDGAIPFPTLPLFLFSSLFAPASLAIMLPAVICSSCRPEHSAPANQRLRERCGLFHYGSTCALYTIWDMGFLFLYPASPAAEGSAEVPNTRTAGGKKSITQPKACRFQTPASVLSEAFGAFYSPQHKLEAELSPYVGRVAEVSLIRLEKLHQLVGWVKKHVLLVDGNRSRLLRFFRNLHSCRSIFFFFFLLFF